MNRFIKVLLLAGFLVLVFKVGEIIWRHIDKDYSNKVKVETWTNRISEFQKQETEHSIEKKLEDYFENIDSVNIIESVGCFQGYFGYLNSEHVIRIPSAIYTEKETNKEYDLSEKGLQCELLIFEKDSSHLANICTDIIVANYPKPKRSIKSVGGIMKVIIGNEEKLWGNDVNNAYIRIDEVEFMDSLNNKKIVFKNKFLMKVLNLGVPG